MYDICFTHDICVCDLTQEKRIMFSNTPIARCCLVGCLAAVVLIATLPVQAATIAHRYDFEADDGSDTAGGMNGTLMGDPTFSAGAISGSRAILLDGDGDYVDFPDAMDFGSQFSIALWVQPEAGALGIQNLIANAPGGWATDGFKLYYNTWSDPATADNALIIETGNAAAAGDASRTGAGAITEGSWNHVVTTIDTIAGEARMYVDGVDAGATGGLIADMNVNQDWEIGAMKSGWNLSGSIDDVQVYSGVLSADEAAWLSSNPGAVIPEPGTLVLIFVGGLSLLACRWQRRRRTAA